MVANLLQSFAAQTASLANQAVTRAQAQGVPLSFAPQRFYAGPLSQAVIDDLIGQGFVYDPASQGFTPPAGYTGSAADFMEGVRRAEARAAPPPTPPPTQIQPPSLPGAGLLPPAAPPQQITPPSLPGGGLATTGVGGGGVAFSQSTGYGTVGTEQERLRQAQIEQGAYRDLAALGEYQAMVPPAAPPPVDILGGERAQGTLRQQGLATGAISGDYGSLIPQPVRDLAGYGAQAAGQAFEPIAPVVSAIGQGAQDFANIPFISAPGTPTGLQPRTTATLGQTGLETTTGDPFGLRPIYRAGGEAVGGPLGISNELGFLAENVLPSSPLELALAPTGLGLAGDVTDLAKLGRGGVGLVRGGVEAAGDIAQAGARGLGAPQGVGYFGGLPTGPGDDLMAQLEASLRMTPEELRVRGAEAARQTEQASRLAAREAAEPFRQAAIERQLINQMGGAPPPSATPVNQMGVDALADEAVRLGLDPVLVSRLQNANGRSQLEGMVEQARQGGVPPAPVRGQVGQGELWTPEVPVARTPPSPPRTPPPQGPSLPGGPPLDGASAEGTNAFMRELTGLLRVPKTFQASGDILGSSFRQNLPVFWIDPKIWSKNAARSMRAYFGGDDIAKGVFAEIQQLPRFANDEVIQVGGQTITVPSMQKVLGLGEDFATPGFEKLDDAVVTRLLAKFPLVGRSERSMRAALIGAATDLRNQMIDAAMRAGVVDESWYKHYGDIAKISVGYGDVPEALRGISNTFYSLRNTVARFQTFTQPFTKPGQVFRSPLAMARDRSIFSASPRGVATKNITRFIAGEMANLQLLAAAGASSGLFEVGANPLGPGFGRITYTDDEGNEFSADLLGGYGSLIKASVRTGAAAYDSAAGRETRFDPVVDWANFTRYKLAPVPALGLDSLIAISPGFRDVEALQTPFSFDPTKIEITDPNTWLEAGILEKVLPFFAGGPIQALAEGSLPTTQEGLIKAATTMLAGWVGIPSDVWPASPWAEADVTIKDEIEAGLLPATYTDSEGNQQPLTEYSQLNREQKAAFDERHPENAQARLEGSNPAIQQLREEQAVYNDIQATQIDALPFGEDWRTARNNNNQQKIGALDAVERANADYFAELDAQEPDPAEPLERTVLREFARLIEGNSTVTGVDWLAVDRAVAGWNPQWVAELERSQLVAGTPKEREYKADIAQLEPYFESRDAFWAKMSQANPEFAKYETFDDFAQALYEKAAQKNPDVPEAALRAGVDSALGSIEEAMSQVGLPMLVQDRHLVELLSKHGFYVPAAVRGWSLPAGQTLPTPVGAAP